MTKRIEIEFKSSVEIMNTPMKKRRFIVDEMIYPGLHVLSGDPKIGKSWMMMDMCLAIAKGEKFLGRKTEQGHVVYMALEDTSDNLQTRMYELTDEPTDNLQYVLLGKKIVVANGIDEIVRQQKAIGRNLNQIATLANMDRLTAVNFQPLLDEHRKVTELIGQLLREVK